MIEIGVFTKYRVGSTLSIVPASSSPHLATTIRAGPRGYMNVQRAVAGPPFAAEVVGLGFIHHWVAGSLCPRSFRLCRRCLRSRFRFRFRFLRRRLAQLAIRYFA